MDSPLDISIIKHKAYKLSLKEFIIVDLKKLQSHILQYSTGPYSHLKSLNKASDHHGHHNI